MDPFRITLLITTLLCSLVAGFLFAFAVVVMPGIKTLNDHDFLQAFKVMDRVIQNNQPIFLLVWLGSVVALLISAMIGTWQLAGVDRLHLIVSCAIYLFGVQLPTVAINVPLNNQLQAQDFDVMNEAGLHEVRKGFESRWEFWNSIRTVHALMTTILLILLTLRL